MHNLRPISLVAIHSSVSHNQPVQNETHDASTTAFKDRWWIRAQNVLTLAALVFAPWFNSGSFNPLRIAVGALPVLLGACIGISAVRTLGTNRTPHPSPLTDSKLVQHGIYSFVRHPLYVSLMLITFGCSIIFKSLPSLICSIALALLLDRKARLEENYLTQQFSEYQSYAARVRRFIPRIY